MYWSKKIETIEPANPFKKLPELADRLGVPPLSNDRKREATVMVSSDDRSYCIFDLVNAFLDRLDNETLAETMDKDERTTALIKIALSDTTSADKLRKIAMKALKWKDAK